MAPWVAFKTRSWDEATHWGGGNGVPAIQPFGSESRGAPRGDVVPPMAPPEGHTEPMRTRGTEARPGGLAQQGTVDVSACPLSIRSWGPRVPSTQPNRPPPLVTVAGPRLPEADPASPSTREASGSPCHGSSSRRDDPAPAVTCPPGPRGGVGRGLLCPSGEPPAPGLCLVSGPLEPRVIPDGKPGRSHHPVAGRPGTSDQDVPGGHRPPRLEALPRSRLPPSRPLPGSGGRWAATCGWWRPAARAWCGALATTAPPGCTRAATVAAASKVRAAHTPEPSQQRLPAPPPPSRRAVPSSSPAGGPAPTTATLRCSHSAGSWLTGDLHRCQPPQTVLLGPAQEA